jgi:multiple sugar transport system substrate-binding protein
LIKSDPELTVFAAEFDSARSRTAQLGSSYPVVSAAVQQAIQAAITGVKTPAQALADAQAHVESVKP